jgi:MoxR-like ATPase
VDDGFAITIRPGARRAAEMRFTTRLGNVVMRLRAAGIEQFARRAVSFYPDALPILPMTTTTELTEQVKRAAHWVAPLQEQMARVVVGQKTLIDGLLTGLLTNGHVLLEGVPGLAKTLTVRTLAAAVQTGFSRIQFTPDLLPADLIGTLIYNPRTAEFITKQGPLFSNLILADEINRAPAKVQSALLEAMQERQVTLGDTTYPLPDPFLVLATQNPIEQEGTYNLPEAQVDRFLLKLKVGYPSRAEERLILDRMGTSAPKLDVQAVVTAADIVDARGVVNEIYVDDRVKDYIVDVVFATREPSKYKLKLEGMIRCGASPRATIALTLAAKANAFLQGRGYVTPQDVKTIGYDVLRHRIMVSYEAEAEEVTSEQIVERIFGGLPVP